ncbi:MAG: hypothetical protein IKE55_06470 [Kiritimatiellae bacterium]|nr:hypothetical protein [Kiritimatiellia bacterium]
MALCAFAPFAARAGFTKSGTIGSSDVGMTLKDGTVYMVPSSTTLTRTTPYAALYVKDNSTAVIYIPTGVTFTVRGGNASGTESAGAGIRIEEGSTLIVTGEGSLIATGGNAANGAAAAIGGSGGNGGTGGDGYRTDTDGDCDKNGNDGTGGGNGKNGYSMGTLYVLGSVTVNATGGSKGTGGGTSDTGDTASYGYKYACGGGGAGAGIGGNNGDMIWSGSITIAGGTVEAHSSPNDDLGEAAGISAGRGGKCGPVRITGGRVYAYSGTKYSYASAGIGGSLGMDHDGSDGVIEISGGTVYACGGYQDEGIFAADIGDGLTYSTAYANNKAVVITGGNVVLAHFDSEKARFTQSRCAVTNVAHDASGRVVHAVVVPLGTPDAAVELAGPAGYGTRDVYADADGDVYLWLPDGDYEFTIGGARWTATVDGADTAAEADSVAPESLHIESVEVAPDKVTLVVSAVPDGWLAIFASQLRVRAGETLPLPDGVDALLSVDEVSISPKGDGTAIVIIPRTPAAARFFSVEWRSP